jgi:hypothetical protein
MLQRLNDLYLTTTDTALVTAVDSAEAAFLRYGKDLAQFLDGPFTNCDCAYALAFAAALHLMTLTAQGGQNAEPFLTRAKTTVENATRHEQEFVAAIAAWAAGDQNGAIARHMAIAHAWPRDLISVKILHFHQINQGDFSGILKSLEPIFAVMPECRFLHGMQAFALAQCGDTRAAESAGRFAASLGFDPHACHAVAHVLDSDERAREGRAWMQDNCSAWEDCSSFMYTHNWWHAALFDIRLGDHDAALALFDTKVWGIRRDCCQDQINAVSLLARLEMLGVDPGNRWQDLAPHLKKRVFDGTNALADMHYAYGLARSGADGALAVLTYHLRERACDGALADRLIAVAIDGMVAHARGQHVQAAATLHAVRRNTACFGGSNTQRRLIELVALDATRRSTSPTILPDHFRELICTL